MKKITDLADLKVGDWILITGAFLRVKSYYIKGINIEESVLLLGRVETKNDDIICYRVNDVEKIYFVAAGKKRKWLRFIPAAIRNNICPYVPVEI